MLGLAIWVFLAVHNGHRLWGILALAGIVCVAIGLGVRRAGRRAD